MKILLVLTLCILVTAVWAKSGDVNDFNQILIQKMQKDLQKDNVDEFKKKEASDRKPASVENYEGTEQPEQKINKQLKQIGSPKW
ncbi:MAG TPA: hypothetical protein VNJ08_17335 [Bacteriovoracaceae bacterium]|nr:hypothetical protein [Bacteriovoracaceae bacterium]